MYKCSYFPELNNPSNEVQNRMSELGLPLDFASFIKYVKAGNFECNENHPISKYNKKLCYLCSILKGAHQVKLTKENLEGHLRNVWNVIIDTIEEGVNHV